MLVQIDDLPAAYNLVLYDNMGRIVYHQQHINEAQFTIQGQQFPAGVYYLNIQFDNPAYAPIRAKVVFR